MKKMIRVPVPQDPVICGENSDGSLCWPYPGYPRRYARIEKLDDVPPDYLNPPSRWVEVEDDDDG